MVARHPGRTRLLVLLEEAGNIPKIPTSTLKTSLSLLPGKGLRLYTIWQSISQMNELYGSNLSRLIMDQSSMLQAWSIRDLEQQEQWSKRAGKTTVKRQSFNKDSQEMDYPWTLRMDEKEEQVLPESHIAQMPDHYQLISISGHPLIVAERVPFWQVKEFREWAAPNPCEPQGYPVDQPVRFTLRSRTRCA